MLLFQVGDFYEFFSDDARQASHVSYRVLHWWHYGDVTSSLADAMAEQLLNLALTRKSKQATDLEDMCGFPLTSLDFYVEKLVRACSSLVLVRWRRLTPSCGHCCV